MTRERKGQRVSLPFLLLPVLVIAVFIVLYLGGRWFERRMQKPETRGDLSQRYVYEDLVDYNGDRYRPRTDIVTILLMGIDREALSQPVSGYRNGGQADFLRLLIINSTEKTVSQIQIDRDTMTPITVLGVLGNKSGIRTAQVSLSHGFGDGKAQSCELTTEAVSNLFFGIPIDFYMALSMDGISVLNDMLGGITVTLEEDFSALDPAMTKGATLTLMGDQAEYYTRYRKNIGEGTNESRMARQEQYISKLSHKLYDRISENKDYVETAYDAMLPYMITDISRGRLINEVWAAKDYRRDATIKPAGSHVIGGDGFTQFYVDEAALQQTIMELFYQRMQ